MKSPNLRYSSISLVALALFLAPSSRGEGGAKEESVSCGSANRGGLGNAAELAIKGKYWRMPRTWKKREYNFGTDELVTMIERAAEKVYKEGDNAILGVGDLSAEEGGAIPRHRSHQSGRDVDLIYYAVDKQGDPLEPIDTMPFYRKDGRATHATAPKRKKIKTRWFDHESNWLLVKTLVEDKDAGVERIFVSLRVYRWLVAAGEDAGDKEALEAVKAVLRVGKAGENHGDHMHVRIKCTKEDTRVGLCRSYLAPNKKDGTKWRWGVRCPR